MANRTNHPGKKTEKQWRDALLVAVKRHAYGTGGPRLLAAIASKVVSKAADGDMVAAKEIGDRLDGKPVQGLAVEVGVRITHIERRIVDPVIEGECEVVALDAAKSNGVEPNDPYRQPRQPRKLSDRGSGRR